MPTATGVTADAADQQEEQTGSLATAENDDDDETSHEEFVPYKAHKDVRGKLKTATGELDLTKKELAEIRAEFDTLKDYKDFIADLKRDGINNSDDVRALIAKTNGESAEQQFQQIERQSAIAYHKAINEDDVPQAIALREYNATVRLAKADMRDKQNNLREAELKRTSTGTVAQRIKAATDKYSEADPDLLRKLSSIPGVDIEAEAKSLHDKEIARQSKYAVEKAKQKDTKGSGNKEGLTATQAAATACPDPLKYPKDAKKWLDAQTAKLNRAASS